MWDIETGCELLQFQGHKALSIAYAPDSGTIALGGEDNVISLWDIPTGDMFGQLDGYAKPITSIVFSPDGQALLTGSVDKTARLWNLSAWMTRQRRAAHPLKLALTEAR